MSIHFSQPARDYLEAFTVSPDQIDWMDENGFGWTEPPEEGESEPRDYDLEWPTTHGFNYKELRRRMSVADLIQGDTRNLTIDDPHIITAPDGEDPVNHPAHYNAFGAEIIEITEHLSFCAGNAVKYLTRAGLKDPAKHVEDLEKAAWYVAREIARVKRQKDEEPHAHRS